MPLSVPLLLVPGEPDRHYTVHLHRVRWSVGAVSVPLTADHLKALGANAERGLRMVSECIAAELSEPDVEVTQNPDGSAGAVARVLCTEDECAAVAERYRRDTDEDVEAEAARKWAATRLQDHTVELLKLRGELEKTMPGKTVASAKDMLAAVLAVQQERTGGTTDRVVLMLDEAAYFAGVAGLFPDRTPEDVRAEIEHLIRTGRKPDPTESAEEVFVGQMGGGKTTFRPHRLTDFDSAPDSVTWVGPARGTVPMLPANEVLDYLGRPDAAELTPERLVRETEELARSVAAGEAPNAGVMRLGQLSREVARRCDAEPNPPCPVDCEQDDDPGHALKRRIGYRPRAVRAGEVRAALVGVGRDWSLRTLPDAWPEDDAAPVLVYREPTPGLALLEHIRTGDEEAVQNDMTLLVRWLTADGK
ncbi:hypothetical protein [Streptomyces sp. CB03238]|uniref:hypothetical protein n=1 Tax=Streptomyces sp. CB03238 TaxID=1907777 RepID=UPI000A106335|nr:hypothetical protein [Streptomyces sp. CB03238]ORT54651.1 hypothetical protein BKD26_34735 [Streptomyces sp. CB03238]